MITALEASARLTSDSVIAPTAACTTLTLTSSVESPPSACTSASCEPCTSALMSSGSNLTAPSPMLLEQVLELRGLLLRELHVAELALAEQRDLARLALVAERHHVLARAGHVRQALDLDRDRRAGLGDRAAVLVEHGAHAAE